MKRTLSMGTALTTVLLLALVTACTGQTGQLRGSVAKQEPAADAVTTPPAGDETDAKRPLPTIKPRIPIQSTGACVAAPAGLVHRRYPLDEASGTTAADITSGNDGQHVNGPQPDDGVVDGALHFQAGNQAMVAPDQPSLDFGTAGDFTIDAWVKGCAPAAKSGAVEVRCTIINKGPNEGGTTANAGAGFTLWLAGSPWTLKLRLAVPTGNVDISGPVWPKDGDWHFVAVSVDRDDGVTFMLDGATTNQPGPTDGYDLSNGDPLRLASLNSSTPHEFPGLMDEVEIFSRALAEEELLTIFRAGTSGKCKPDDPTPVPPVASACCQSLSFRAGNSDGFDTADGSEPAAPSTGLVTRLTAGGVQKWKGFDDPAIDTYFVHTFQLPAGQCLQAAALYVRAKPEGNASNDAMTLSFTDAAGKPDATYGDAVAYLGTPNGTTPLGLVPNMPWQAPNFASGRTLLVNLGQPGPAVAGTGAATLLQALNARRFLDVIIQDDTTIDWLGLDVKFCDCPDGSGVVDDPSLAAPSDE